MAFPTSPVYGQLHKKYYWDEPASAWRNAVEVKKMGTLIEEPGEVLSPSEEQPLLCVTDFTVSKTVSATNAPLFIPFLRSKKLQIDGETEIAVTASGAVITLPDTDIGNKLYSALVEHDLSYDDDPDCRPIVVLDGTEYTIVDYPNTREVELNASPSSGDAVFYPFRLIGSDTTAKVLSRIGRSPIGANGAEGSTISGLMRRDQMQGHWHSGNYTDDITVQSGAGAGFSRIIGGSSKNLTYGVNDAIRSPITDGVNGDPVLTGTTTHSPDSAVNFYFHTGLWIEV
jgi:hypothetical protein